MNKSLLSTLRVIVLLAVGAGLLWLAFRGVDLETALASFQEINYLWLGISMLAGIIAFVSRAYRWNLLIEPLGYKPRFYNTNNSLMVGYLANLAVPRLGEITRCGSLSRAEKIPFDKLLGTVIVERLLDVVCLALCMLATAWLEYDRLGSFLTESIIAPLKSKAGGIADRPMIPVIFLLSLTAFIVWRKLRRSSAPSGRPGWQEKIRNMVSGVVAGLRSVRQLNRPVLFIVHTLLIWFMYFVSSYTCFSALPATSALGWKAGLFALVVGGMGMSAPVQGGIGAYHLLVSRGLGLYGISNVNGLAFATLIHTSQTLLVILLGGIAFLLLSIGNNKTETNVNH